jgi:phospholipase C
MQSRRDFIKKAGMLAGAAGFAGGVPASIQKAFAIAPTAGTTWEDAEHVVILMQENRSFDHALGTLQGVRGFDDPRAIRQANGNSIFLQTDLSGATYAPWRLDIKDTKITWMGSIPHSRDSQVDAWNQGHHNTWIDSKKSHNPAYFNVPITMGHYTREDIPFYYALADAFTVCDQNYCGVMTSTTPNRSLLWTGTVRDAQNSNSRVYMRNPQFSGSNLKWKTYPERLHEAGISFKIYQNEINSKGALVGEESKWLGNVGNITEHFSAFNVHMSHAGTQGIQQQLLAAKAQLKILQESPLSNDVKDDRISDVKDLQAHIVALQKELKRNSGDLSKLSPAEQELHMRAFTTNASNDDYHTLETISYEDAGSTVKLQVPKGDIFHQFRQDVDSGHLPTVSWLTPPGMFSDHPANPWYGAWYVSEAVDILTKNPEVWKKTIFILTYDENDGYFDHAPSFVAADPANRGSGRASAGIDTGLEYSYAPDELAQDVSKSEARSGPIGLGFRVPMIVASPWSRGGYVNSQLFDQTCTLQFLEKFVEAKFGKQVKETNLSEFRRTIVGDLTSVFRPFDGKHLDLPFLQRNNFVQGIRRAKTKDIPSNYVKLTPEKIAEYNKDPRKLAEASHQEPGIRPACALPYEMYCEGDFDADRKVFGLAMRAGNAVHGTRSAGAPYNVYMRNTAQKSGALTRGENNQNMHVATYVVKAGDTMQEGIPLQLFANGKYDIDVHGPNGFYRAFRGDSSVPSIVVRCVYQRTANGITGNVEARIKNQTDKPLTVHVADNSYKTGTRNKELAAREQLAIPLDLSKSHGWYDFTVQAHGSSTSARYAGRVETGKASFTDPLMGGVMA